MSTRANSEPTETNINKTHPAGVDTAKRDPAKTDLAERHSDVINQRVPKREFKHWLFPVYARAFRPRRKPRKRRPTDRGQMILTGSVLTAALGLNTESSFVYQLFALLLCLAIAARITLRFSKPNVSVERLLPRYATAGQKFSYRVRVKNIGDSIELDLTILDVPLSVTPNRYQYSTQFEPNEASRNAYDRFIGFHRFIYLQKQLTGISTTPGKLLELGINDTLDVEVEASALRRGKVEMQEIVILHQDPLGLNYGFNHFPANESLLILPKRYRVGTSLQISSGNSFQTGSSSSPWSTGESEEFVSLRDYREGDAMRKIHWPSSAKQAAKKQNLVVKEYQDEFFSRNALVTDINHNSNAIIEETVSVAASFALTLNGDDTLVDLIYLNQNEIKIITTGKGTLSANQQLEALATMQPNPDQSESDFERLSEAVLRHSQSITGCYLVFASWQKKHADLIRKLSAQNVNFRCFVVSEKPIPSGPFTLLRSDSIQADLLAA